MNVRILFPLLLVGVSLSLRPAHGGISNSASYPSNDPAALRSSEPGAPAANGAASAGSPARADAGVQNTFEVPGLGNFSLHPSELISEVEPRMTSFPLAAQNAVQTAPDPVLSALPVHGQIANLAPSPLRPDAPELFGALLLLIFATLHYVTRSSVFTSLKIACTNGGDESRLPSALAARGETR